MKFKPLTVIALSLLFAPGVFAQRRSESIRSIDFKNFTYALPADLRTPGGRRFFTLRGGRYPGTGNEDEMYFARVVYGDVTGDGAEEAMIYLGIQTRGSAMPGVAYVYTMQGRRPRLLWSFSTGDRAGGGLHKIYAEGGELVAELYGPQEKWEGDGQLMRFTRRRYVWRGQRFRQRGRKEVIPLPAQSNIGMNRTRNKRPS
jgi:hypothetical protein